MGGRRRGGVGATGVAERIKIIRHTQKHKIAEKIKLSKGFMAGKSDLSQGANACMHVSAFISMCTSIFSQRFQ